MVLPETGADVVHLNIYLQDSTCPYKYITDVICDIKMSTLHDGHYYFHDFYS